MEHSVKFGIEILKLAVVNVLQTTQNLVISRCCFAEDGKEMYKNYDARAQPLFCSIKLLFSDFDVAVAVVVFFNPLLFTPCLCEISLELIDKV